MNNKKRYTLHDYSVRTGPSAEEIRLIKEAAIKNFKTKVVWNKQTARLVDLLGQQAYIFNPETNTFEIDIEYAKEMALLGSLDFDGGKFFIGW